MGNIIAIRRKDVILTKYYKYIYHYISTVLNVI